MIAEWVAQHPDVIRAVVAIAGIVIVCAAAWLLGRELCVGDIDEDEHAKNPFRW